MESKIIDILNIAIKAPSGDNSQPWKFDIKGSTCTIYLINKDNPYLNHKLSGTFISHGALIENIVQVAANSNISTDISLFPEKNRLDITAKIIFGEKVVDRAFPLSNDHIIKRATNRNIYNDTKIPENIIMTLNQEIMSLQEHNNISISFNINSKFFGLVGRAGSTMEEIAFSNKILHKEFFRSIIWNEKEEREKKTGLYIKTFEVPKPVEYIFRLIKNWHIISFFNKIGFNKKIAENNAKNYAQASGFGLLSIKNDKPETIIALGRVMQRIWVFLNKEGIEFQLVTGILFLGYKLRDDEPEWISNEEKIKIEEACNKIREIFEVNPIDTPLILFRFGYGTKPSTYTSRYSINELIIK